MSSIMSATAMPQSPLSRLQAELASEVSDGTISSADQSALSTALTDINSEMQSSAPTAGSAPPSPDEMQSKINDLIQGEVSSGNLTSAQADELKNVFAQTFQGGPGGPGGPGGSGGPGGPGGSSSSDSSSSASSTDSSNSSTSQMLTDFLKLLKDAQSSSSTYGANGDTLSSQIQSLLVNFQT